MSTWMSVHLREDSSNEEIAEILEHMAKVIRTLPIEAGAIEIVEDKIRQKVLGRIKIGRNNTIMRTSGLATIMQERLSQQNVEHISYRRVEAAVSDALHEIDFKSEIGDAIEFPSGTFWRKT